jgi:hypothetical protein
MGISHQNEASRPRYVKNTSFIGGHITIQDGCHTKLANSSNTALNEFICPENMGLGTKIQSICSLHIDICAKHDLIGDHFEIENGRYRQTKYTISFILQ